MAGSDRPLRNTTSGRQAEIVESAESMSGAERANRNFRRHHQLGAFGQPEFMPDADVVPARDQPGQGAAR